MDLVYLARATSKSAVKLEEQVVVLGLDDMGFGLSGSERLRTLTADVNETKYGLCICLVDGTCHGNSKAMTRAMIPVLSDPGVGRHICDHVTRDKRN